MVRKYIRHPTEIPIEVTSKEGEATDCRHMQDIGYGGLCFDSQQRLDKGSDVVIKIKVREPAFEISAHVIWCRKKENIFEIGVAFCEQDEAYRVRMVEQVCHIEQYRKAVSRHEGRELSSEEAAYEWIRKFAPQFPELASS